MLLFKDSVAFESGIAHCYPSLVHCNFLHFDVRPDLLDFAKLQPAQHGNNLNQAFTIAEEQLGVTKLLDPEGLSLSFCSILQMQHA